MSGFEVYLILMLDGIKDLMVLLWSASTISVFVCGLYMFFTHIDYSGSWNSEHASIGSLSAKKGFLLAKKGLKKLIIIFIITGILFAFIPSTKQMAVILLLPNITTGDTMKEASKMPPKVLKILNDKMDEWVSDQIETKTKK